VDRKRSREEMDKLQQTHDVSFEDMLNYAIGIKDVDARTGRKRTGLDILDLES
jgi:hypothetical protein